MIILASRSKARRKILKDLGLKFKVMPAFVEEREAGREAGRKAGGSSPQETVKANALLKARDVARRVGKGVVIGCDTLVEQRGKIFGKPKDLKDAADMLKKLSSRPHFLYTGIAVIDAARGKEIVDVATTKIFMAKLSDGTIARYFKRATPLEWAGGFDIQGRGALFIKRIEGCYFNVVGLPVSKLFACFKKIGISLL